MTEQTPGTDVQQNEDGQQYEIHVDGTLAGVTQYVDRGKQRIFYHTEVGEEFSGRGLAGQLVGEALTDTRRAGLRAVPVCPYVAKYVRRHEEYVDMVDPVTPDVLAWMKARPE